MPIVNSKYNCVHCNNKQMPERVEIIEYEVDEIANDDTIEGSESPPSASAYYVCICSVCQKPAIFHTSGIVLTDFDSKKTEVVFPINMLDKYRGILPNKVYKATLAAYAALPSEMFVVGVRKVLESVCHDKEATGDNLLKKIESLSRGGVFTDIISKAGHVIRLIGNKAAHGDGVTMPLIVASEELMRLVLDFVYVIPVRVADLEVAVSSLPRER